MDGDVDIDMTMTGCNAGTPAGGSFTNKRHDDLEPDNFRDDGPG